MIDEKEDKKKLGLKIVNIMSHMGGVQEDGHNKFSNYNYISADQLVSILRVKLPQEGLAILPEVEKFTEVPRINDNGKESIRTIVEMSFEIIDLETGFSIKKRWKDADQDTGGKSFGQAVTQCTKRFYLKLFNVSSKADIDPDSKTTEVEQVRPIANWINALENSKTLAILEKTVVGFNKVHKNYPPLEKSEFVATKDLRKAALTDEAR